MKTFIQLKGGETINVAHIVKFVENPDGGSIEIFLSDGTKRALKDMGAMNKFTKGLQDQTIFTY